MKNQIAQFSVTLIALVALFFLMAYTKPATDEPKQYIIVKSTNQEKFEQDVTQKLSEGWRLQGGVSAYSSGGSQAMIK